jgi:hypothetical protein
VLRHWFGAEADCWSMGVATYILLTGRVPFNGATERCAQRRRRSSACVQHQST